MKRKQIKSKPKELKPSPKESEDTTSPSFKYSTEEFSTAITLASIMTKENVDQSVGQTVDVINISDNSTNESKDESYECVSTSKRTSNESLQKLQTLDSVPVSSAKPINQNPVNPTQTPMNENSYINPNYYGFYPMDPYGYYYQYPYYGTYSMQPNFSAMPSRPMQCPYCSMTSPPMAPIPMHPSFPMPYNMAAEPQKKISEPMGANTQVMSTQIPISSLYPYYQNGPKVTSAYVSSSEGQQN